MDDQIQAEDVVIIVDLPLLEKQIKILGNQ